MKKTEWNDDVDMTFSGSGEWHYDIGLPSDAQITEIHLRVYSFPFPDNIYTLGWSAVKIQGNQLLIPIRAVKTGVSVKTEAVRLAFDISFYSNPQ